MLSSWRKRTTMNCSMPVCRFMNIHRALCMQKYLQAMTAKAVVGTINMDYRSLYLHFECAAFLYENSEIPAVENDFQETLKKCQKITQEDYKKQKSFDKIAGRILRVFAPLM